MRNYFIQLRNAAKARQAQRDRTATAERMLATDCAETEARIAVALGHRPNAADVMELWSAWERGNA